MNQNKEKEPFWRTYVRIAWGGPHLIALPLILIALFVVNTSGPDAAGPFARLAHPLTRVILAVLMLVYVIVPVAAFIFESIRKRFQ